MGTTDAPTDRPRALRPRAFLLGVAAAFAGCCLAGRLAARRPLLGRVERFHTLVSPMGQFYPTASQLRRLGEARLDPGKVVVVVGWNSVLYGVGQSPGGVWTRRLQEELGDGYQVVNLALPGAQPHEFGAVAAEIFAARCPRVILVTGAWPGHNAGSPDGIIYPYLFWDAYYKGMLRPDPDRDAALAQEARRDVPDPHPKVSPVGRELRLAMRLDGGCYFADLWNGLAYTTASTAWCRLVPGRWYRPRRAFADDGRAVGPAESYPARLDDESMTLLRTMVGRADWGDDPDGPYWQALRRGWREAFPAPARPRTLFLAIPVSPRYLRRLPPGDRASYGRLMGTMVESLRREGFAAAAVGAGFDEGDYWDLLHPSEAGGRKLAAEVAPLVRRAAADLGYDR
jgi:hypothetical protein